ncbi:MAG: hypothetical protein E7298_00565 [Lachnospiraceae bacterium]|nr:hypothetical protein [Lachnospiraceae bacterium]
MKKKCDRIIPAIVILFVCVLICCVSKFYRIIGDFIKNNGGWLVFIQTICSVISLVSIIVLVKQYVSEHEKSRREMAVNLLFRWSEKAGPKFNRIKKIAEKLTNEQCRDLYGEKPFKVTNEMREELRSALGNTEDTDTEEESEKLVELTKSEVDQFRTKVIDYLNLTESVLSAWQYSVVDDSIIENEFGFLLNDSEGKTLLENMRKAAGSENSYPAIEKFCHHISNKREASLERKDKIG